MNEKLNCPFFVYGDWCDDFDGPCAVVNSNKCEVYEQIRKRDVRIAELEAENKRLRECLSKFPKWGKDFPVGYCPMSGFYEFNTIISEAEELLKGAGKC